MQQDITVTLPPEIQKALDDVTRREGVSQNDVISQAVKEHLFLRQFRSLRQRMAAKAAAQGIFTDQDVFDRVS